MKNHQIWIRMFCCWLILVNLLITLSGCGKNLQARMMEQLDLGNRYLVELNYQEASIAFEKAIQLEDRNVDAWLGLAQANVGLANNAEGAQSESYYTKAEDAYLKVIELDPERTESYLELAQVYEATGQTEQAIALLEGALDKVSQREQMEKLLEELRQRHPGTVRMTVLSQTTPGMPVADVEVVLENGQNRFTGTTDENGTFQQQVPVGTYSVIIRDGDEEVYRQDFRVTPDETLELGEIPVDDISVLIKIDSYVKQGEEYLGKEDYQEAESAFASALELDPERCAVYLKRAELYVKWAESFGNGSSIGLSDEMLALYQKALQDYRTALDLGDSEALYKDGYCDVYDIMADLYERIGDEEGYWEIIGESKG